MCEDRNSVSAYLVVRSTSANVDLDALLDQLSAVLLQGTDDTLEGGSDVGEVGNTSTNDKDLALGVGSTGDKVDLKRNER